MEVKQSFVITCFVAIALVIVLAIFSSAHAPEENTFNELPRSWDTEGIANELRTSGASGSVRFYILAWKVTEDERPLRLESCLVLKILDKRKGYWLGHMCRRPADAKPEWRLSTTYVIDDSGTEDSRDVCIAHAKFFQERPSNKQLYDALSFKEVNWPFKQQKGWRLLSCGVCEMSWRQAIGEKPNQFFER